LGDFWGSPPPKGPSAEVLPVAKPWSEKDPSSTPPGTPSPDAMTQCKKGKKRWDKNG